MGYVYWKCISKKVILLIQLKKFGNTAVKV